MEVSVGVALITGGGSGLGMAVAQRLHRAGAMVVILGRPSSHGKVVADELGERAAFVAADVVDEDQITAALDTAAELGTLRVAVNCAGVMSAARVVAKEGPHSLADFARVIRVNLLGTFNVTRLAAERMVSAKPVQGERGVIVNTASVAAFDGQTGQAAYGASKGGIVAMTLPLARELSQHQIRVNTVAPGLFDTPLLSAVPQERKRQLTATTPHPKRLGLPDEFAALVEHVVTNPMLNGETVRLDGAIRMPFS